MSFGSGIIVSQNPVAVFRQRGFAIGRYNRDEHATRASATQAGEEALAAFKAGLRSGKRERERAL